MALSGARPDFARLLPLSRNYRFFRGRIPTDNFARFARHHDGFPTFGGVRGVEGVLGLDVGDD